MSSMESPDLRPADTAATSAVDPLAVIRAASSRWRTLLSIAVASAVLGFGASYLMTPIYASQTTFLPPQQQGSASAALASLGALANLAGAGAGPKSPTDQIVGLMQSLTVSERMIARFDLMKVYDLDLHEKARRQLAKRTTITVGKKDDLVTVVVEDTDAKRAKAMADAYVDELRQLTSGLAISEAQRRRVFFDKQLQDAKNRLTKAQTALQETGFSLGALRSEPRTAADSYARLRAEVTASEVRLQTMRGVYAQNSSEMRQELDRLSALQSQLREQERNEEMPSGAGADYVSKYREFKYQETLFDLMARQYELARIDESREGPLIQVVDAALLPERRVRPRRLEIAAAASAATTVACALFLMFSARLRQNGKR